MRDGKKEEGEIHLLLSGIIFIILTNLSGPAYNPPPPPPKPRDRRRMEDGRGSRTDTASVSVGGGRCWMGGWLVGQKGGGFHERAVANFWALA